MNATQALSCSAVDCRGTDATGNFAAASASIPLCQLTAGHNFAVHTIPYLPGSGGMAEV